VWWKVSQRGGFAETFRYFPHSFIYVFPFLMASGTFLGVTLSTKKPGPFNVAAEVFLGVLALVLLALAIPYVTRPWPYHIREDSLLADRFCGRSVTAIAWPDILSVHKAQRRDLLRNFPEIEVALLCH